MREPYIFRCHQCGDRFRVELDDAVMPEGKPRAACPNCGQPECYDWKCVSSDIQVGVMWDPHHRFYNMRPGHKTQEAEWVEKGKLKRDESGRLFAVCPTKQDYMNNLKELGFMDKGGDGKLDRSRQLGREYETKTEREIRESAVKEKDIS